MKTTGQSGQAVVEFAVVVVIMATLVFGMIDFGRALYQKEVITNLSREGSNLASRGADLTTTIAAVMEGSTPLDLSRRGRVIVTAVYNDNGAYRITDQISQGGIWASSRIGQGIGGSANIPATAIPIPQPNQTVFVTEIFYSYQPSTPVGRLLNIVLPSTIYDVAYF